MSFRITTTHHFALCLTVSIAVVAVLTSCADDRHPYSRFEPALVKDSISGQGLYAVIEIPAGTTQLLELDTTSGHVAPASRQPINFLPFPGNFGFVSGTLSPGTGRPVEVLVLTYALAPESVVHIIPIAVLQLDQAGSGHEIVVAVPSDQELQSIKVDKFVDFITEYDAARNIIQQWFLNYQGFDAFDLVGWQDEVYAKSLVTRLRIPSN